jgi:hypothetical protein
MKLAPLFPAFLLLPLVFISPQVGFAQADTKPLTPSKGAATKTTPNLDADLKERARREQARSLLVALSTDARNFRDSTLRARSLARIADALWQADVDQARTLFRKAWDAAEAADQENDLKQQEEIRRQKAKTGGGYAVNSYPNIRREVLRLTAQHDRALGNEFLDKLTAQKLEAANSAATQKTNPGNLSEALTQRLSVSREMLQNGEIDRALEFAEPALAVVSIDSLNFLTDVREKAPKLADSRYAALLSSAAANQQSDENTVSLLSSYIFTPHLFITFSAVGTSSSQSANTFAPADIAPELRLAFFQTAAGIFLRPLPPPGTDANSVGVEPKYLVLKRLLPFFEQLAPAEMVDSLRAQLSALSSMVSEETRKREDEWITKGVKPDKPTTDEEQTILDKVDRAKTSAERDSLYLRLVYLLLRRGDMRARDYVSKIDDSEMRKGLQAYVDPSLASYSVEKKLTDQALEMASKGELTHLQRAWVLSQCAKLLAKTDKNKALDLIEAASTEARRIDVSDPQLPRALLGVANAILLVEPTRVWDAAFDAVKSANSVEGFTGEDGEIAYRFETKGHRSSSSSDVADFDVQGIFQQLATQDYDRAVELARGFQGEGPRAVATIAIARAVLEKKKPTVVVKN